MKYPALMAVFAVAAAGLIGVQPLNAQQPGFKRVELQRSDLSVAGREAVVARADFDPDGIVGRHTHPGIESAYVMDGELVVKIDGQPDKAVKPGDSWQVPSGAVHDAISGAKGAKVIVTYVVEKGKPLATPAK